MDHPDILERWRCHAQHLQAELPVGCLKPTYFFPRGHNGGLPPGEHLCSAGDSRSRAETLLPERTGRNHSIHYQRHTITQHITQTIELIYQGLPHGKP